MTAATATAAAGDRDPLRSTRPTIVGPSSGPPPPPFPLYLSGPVVRGFGRGSKELGIPTANLDRGNESLKRFLSEVAARTNEQAEEEGQGSSRVQDDSGSARGTGIYFGFARILMPDVVAARKGDDDPSSSSIVPSRETISALPRQTAAYPSAAAAAASTTSTGDQSQLPDHEDDAGAEAAPTHRQSHDGDDDDSKVWPMVMSVGWNPFYGNKELTAVSFPESVVRHRTIRRAARRQIADRNEGVLVRIRKSTSSIITVPTFMVAR